MATPEPDLQHLTARAAALATRFSELGARLADAARGLRDDGAPVAGALVEDLASARGDFTELGSDVLGLAEDAGIVAPSGLETVESLAPIIGAIADARAAQRRRAAIEQARTAVLTILDRVNRMVHNDDPAFPALRLCQARAAQLEEAVGTLSDPAEAQGLTDHVRAFADLLTMVDPPAELDDTRYAQLEDSVERAFGRALAVAAARGRLYIPGEMPEPAPLVEERAVPEPEPEPAPPVPIEVEAEDAADSPLAFDTTPAPVDVAPPPPPVEAAPAWYLDDADLGSRSLDEPEVASLAADGADLAALTEPAELLEPVGAPPEDAVETSAGDAAAPDETANWWLSAWARWSGWKSSRGFADAAREELTKYPYLLSVPIRESPAYEEGLAAYGYSILLDHVERQRPGCVGNALTSLKAGRRSVGDQLYDYMVEAGSLRQTYADFVRDALLSLLPEPGVWVTVRVVDTKDDTRIFRRPSSQVGDTAQTAQRFTVDAKRFVEHTFAMTLPPLTARFVSLSFEMREPRAVEAQLTVDGSLSDTAWLVSLPGPGKAGSAEVARIAAERTRISGLGRDASTLWVAVFNPDPAMTRACELSLLLRKETRTGFSGGRGPAKT